MCCQDIEARRARDLERFHRRTAERRAGGLCLKCGKQPPADGRARVMQNIEDGLTENPSDQQPSGRASSPSCTSPTTSAAGHPERHGHQCHPGRGSA